MEVNRYSEHTIDRAPIIMRMLDRLGTNFNSFDSVVELGSSTGKTITAISKVTENNCYGLDIVPNGEATDNLQFRKADLNEKMEKGFFDDFGKGLFFALDVIEHLENPFKIVKEFEEFAQGGSVLVLSCPNFASIRMLQAWVLGTLPKHEFGFFDKTHLHWLTPRNFREFDSLAFSSYIYSGKMGVKFVQSFLPSRMCSQFIVTFSK